MEYIQLKTESDFNVSVIESDCALLFSENTDNGIIIKAKLSDGTFTNIVDPRANGLKDGFETLTGTSLASIAAGISSLNSSKTAIRNAIAAKGETCTSSTPLSDYAALISNISGGGDIYKCISVGAGTWTGCKYNSETHTVGNTTASLTYSNNVPIVGNYYTQDGLIQCMPVVVNDYILYMPLSSSQSTASTGQAIQDVGSPTFETYSRVPSVSLNGSSQAVRTTGDISTVLSGLTDKISMSCFFNANSLSGNPKIIGGTEGGGLWMYVNTDSNNVFDAGFYINGSYQRVTASSAVSTNSWYHACITYDGTNIKGYLNGELFATTSASGNFGYPSSGTPIAIGGEPDTSGITGNWFNGHVADVKFYNRVLTQVEISAEYRRMMNMVNPYYNQGLVLYVPLASSQSTASTGQTLEVYSGGDTPTFQTYQGLPCAYFNGNSRLDIGNKNTLPYGGTDRTFTGWLNPQRSSSWNDFFFYGKNSTQNAVWGLSLDSLTLKNFGSGSTIDSETSLTQNTWTHIAISYGNSETKFYVNGTLVKTSNEQTRNTIQCWIGIGAGFREYDDSSLAEQFQGYISEIKLFNRVLTQAEITAEYNRLHAMVTA